jgi:hypothetical protein
MKPKFAVWWLNPALLFLVLNGGLAVVTVLTSESAFENLWNTPKFFNGSMMLLTVGCIAAFVVGTVLPQAHIRGWAGSREKIRPAALRLETLLLLYRIAVALALLGYLMWTAIAISHGLNWKIVMDVLASKPRAAYNIRSEYLLGVAGVTTSTQFGIAAVVLGSLIAAQAGWRKVWGSMSLLFALGVIRALLNTERLAILELAVPMLPLIATIVLGPRAERSRRMRIAIVAAPAAGLAALFLIFAAFEYGRSWTTYYSGHGESYWSFALYRLTGYYVTAVNNTAFLLNRLRAPQGIPFFTMNFLWHFPLLNDLVHSLFPNFDLLKTYFDTLNTGANAEFNNSGGLLAPAIDFGYAGTILYWFTGGLIWGWFYQQFKCGSSWGLCFYPLLFLGALEVPRGLYLNGGRAIPPICFLLLSAYVLRVPQLRMMHQRRAERAAAEATSGVLVS